MYRYIRLPVGKLLGPPLEVLLDCACKTQWHVLFQNVPDFATGEYETLRSSIEVLLLRCYMPWFMPLSHLPYQSVDFPVKTTVNSSPNSVTRGNVMLF